MIHKVSFLAYYERSEIMSFFNKIFDFNDEEVVTGLSKELKSLYI